MPIDDAEDDERTDPGRRVVPAYADAEMRELGERLAALYAARDTDPATPVADEIAGIRARMRRGPRLRAGEYLRDGRYRLLDRLQRGKQGDALWKAFDRETGDFVFARVFHGEWVADREAVAAFVRRGDQLEALLHPSIGRVLDADVSEDGFVFLVTELVEGGSLDEVALDPIDAIQVGVEIAQALGYAHGQGVVHGDLQPSNVLLAADGGARVVGFSVTPSGRRDVASLFRAPETTERGYAPAPPADVYALGMTLLQALSGGELPFWVLREPQRLIRALKISEAVKAVVRRATDWDLSARYPDTSSLLEELLSDPELAGALAERARERGRHGVAAGHYEALLRVQPHRAVELRRLLGDLYTQMGAHDRAFVHLLAALERSADVESMFEPLRLVAARTGDWARLADALWTQARARDAGRRVILRMELARVDQEALGDPVAAAETWTQVLADHRTPSQAATALRALQALAGARGDHECFVAYGRELLEYLPASDKPPVEYAIGRACIEHLGDEDQGLAFIDRAEAAGYAGPDGAPPGRPAVDSDPSGRPAAIDSEPSGRPAAVLDSEPSGRPAAVLDSEPSGRPAAVLDSEPSGRPAAVLDFAARLQGIRARLGQWQRVIHLMVQQAAGQELAEASPTLLRAGIIASSVHLEEEAFRIYHALLERAPRHVVALRHLARLHHRAREHDEAVRYYERLWETYRGKPSEEPEASERAADCCAYARLLLERGRTDEALQRLDEALRLNPNHVPSLELAGPLFLGKGDAARAGVAFDRLLSLFSSVELSAHKLGACVGMGDLAWAQGRLTAAMGWYNRATELDPSSVSGWWGLAKVALASRGGHPGADRAPWIVATPLRFTGQEALARLLAGALHPDAMRSWLSLSPLGRALVEGGDTPMRLACAVVDVMARNGVVTRELFDRLGGGCPEWAEPVEEVRRLWFGGAAARFPVARSYGWTKAVIGADFDPLLVRAVLPIELATPPGVSEAPSGPEAWRTLLAGALPPPPEPTPTTEPAEHTAPVLYPGPIGALVRDGASWLVLPRDRVEVTIGSAPGSTLRLVDDLSIREHHARLFRQGARIYLEARSDGRVQVDGEDRDVWRLVGGERVTIGATRLQYQSFDDPSRLPPRARIRALAWAAPAPEPDPLGLPLLDELDDDPSEEEVVEPVHERHPPPVSVPPRFDVDPISEDSGAFEPIHPLPKAAEFRGFTNPISVPPLPDVPPARTPATPPRAARSAPVPKRTRIASLEYMSGPDRGKRVMVGDRLTVGQGPQCGMVILGDTRLSAVHCTVERTPAGYLLVDSGSANGTVVNGQRILEIDLSGGEVIMVGRTVLRFQLEDRE